MRVATVANGEIEFDVVSKELVIDTVLHLFDEGLGAATGLSSRLRMPTAVDRSPAVN